MYWSMDYDSTVPVRSTLPCGTGTRYGVVVSAISVFVYSRTGLPSSFLPQYCSLPSGSDTATIDKTIVMSYSYWEVQDSNRYGSRIPVWVRQTASNESSEP
jgi:hypothetical protein